MSGIIVKNFQGPVTIDNLKIDGNEISSTDEDGDILITPNGDGAVRIGNEISSIDENGDILITPNGGGAVRINKNGSSSSAALSILQPGLAFDSQVVAYLGRNLSKDKSVHFEYVHGSFSYNTYLNIGFYGRGDLLVLECQGSLGKGLVGIGKNPSYKLDVDGDVNVNGVYRINGTDINTKGAEFGKRTATGAADYNPSSLTADYMIAVNNTAVPRAVTISTEDIQSGSPEKPRFFVIKDESGGAGANAITVSGETGNIDGGASAIISQNYASLSIYADGTNLFIY